MRGVFSMKQKTVSLLALMFVAANSPQAQAEESNPIKLSGELAVDVEYAEGYADEKTAIFMSIHFCLT